jgi:ribosome maturation factor RimP
MSTDHPNTDAERHERLDPQGDDADADARGETEDSPSVPAWRAAAAAVRVLEAVVEPLVRTMGYELVLLEWAATARPRVVRLFIDHPGGMTLDDCARLSPIIGNGLDAAEHDPASESLRALLATPYVLEVSSPGVERPLARRSHFERQLGARVTVRTHAPVRPDSSQKTFHGTIAGVRPDPSQPEDDREGIALVADEDGTAVHEISLSLIRRAHLVWTPDPGPTRAPRSKRPSPEKAV